MGNIEMPSLFGFVSVLSKSREQPRGERWIERIGLMVLLLAVCLSVFYRGPRLFLLLYFPTFNLLFIFYAQKVRSPDEAWKRRVFVELALFHCLMMFGVVQIWESVPMLASSGAFVFVVPMLVAIIENSAAKALLAFHRPKE
jgi:hypothetical protein